MNFFSKTSITLIRFYQLLLSPDTGFIGRVLSRHTPTCAFYPTCSEYAVHAIKKHGAITGWFMAFRRVLRCHPWQKPTVDEP